MNILHWNFISFFVYGFIFFVLFRTKKSKRVFTIIMTIQMVIINGFRAEFVGTDTLRYFRSFNAIQNIRSLNELKNLRHEIGYTFIQRIFASLTPNFNLWLIFVAIFTYVSLGWFIYKHSRNCFASYLLFMSLGFWHFSFTGIRQTIAIVIVLYSYDHIIRKDFIRFCITIIFAMVFHSSAVVFFPMYYFANVQWKHIYTLILFGFYGVLYVFRLQIGRALTILFYDEDALALSKYVATGNIGGAALVILAILGIGLLLNNPRKYPERENVVLVRILVASFFVQSLSSFSYLFTRLNMYYLVFLLVYIPFLFENMHRSSIRLDARQVSVVKLFGKVVVYGLLVIYYLFAIEINDGGILPYYFLWQT